MGTYRQHGIIFAESEPLNRKSSVLFNNKYCLAPATVLLNVFDELQQQIQSTTKQDLKKDLRINRIVDTTNNRRYRALNNYNFKIIHEHRNRLFESNARILFIFKSRNIWNSFNDILRGFVARSFSTVDSNKASNLSIDNDLHKLLLSSFVILSILPNEIPATEKPYLPSDILFNIINDSLVKELDQQPEHSVSRQTQRNEDIGIFRMNTVKKLENLESISTPFGNECFLNTINVGKVANIFGDNNCLLVASMPLVFGCEGGAIYNSTKDLIGTVISTTFNWNSENATLTLVANFNEILFEFIQQTNQTNILIEDEIRYGDSRLRGDENDNSLEMHVVLIQSAGTWGTGCFLKIGDTRVIITCAHVIDQNTEEVLCTWKMGQFNSKVIFKNPHFDQAYDIAILDVPSDQTIPDKYFAVCDMTPTKIGQVIYSSGFPHFSSLGTADNFLPSIFEGRVTKIKKGVIFTDASVQSGQSGGPIFSENGHLLGICISNSKDDNYQLIYPNINMSVPIFDILPILQKYGQTKDKRHLNNLVANKEIKSVWALDTPKILSKL